MLASALLAQELRSDMGGSNSGGSRVGKYDHKESFSKWRREIEEIKIRRRRKIQEFSQDEFGGSEEKEYWQRIVGGIIGLAMIGCVRYLPHDAAFYREKLERCEQKRFHCERDLEKCKNLGVDLLHCP